MSTAPKHADIFSQALNGIFDEVEADRARLKGKVDKLKSQQQEIDAKIDALEKGVAKVDEDIAVGLKHAAKDVGVSINVFDTAAPKKKVNRLTPKASDPEIASVLLFIPLKEKHALKVGEIRAKTKFNRREIEWIIGRLLKAGKIQKIGTGNQTTYFKVGK